MASTPCVFCRLNGTCISTRYRLILYRVAASYGFHGEDREEAVQNVVVEFYTRGTLLKYRGSRGSIDKFIGAWAGMICRRYATARDRDLLRRTKRIEWMTGDL